MLREEQKEFKEFVEFIKTLRPNQLSKWMVMMKDNNCRFIITKDKNGMLVTAEKRQEI